MNLLIHVDNSEFIALMVLVALAAAVLIADVALWIFLVYVSRCPRGQAETAAEETAPAEEAAPAEETTPAEETPPAEEAVLAEETAPAEEATAPPAEEAVSTEEAAPAEEAASEEKDQIFCPESENITENI